MNNSNENETLDEEIEKIEEELAEDNEKKSGEKESASKRLVDFVLSLGVKLFIDEFKEPHVAINGDGTEILTVLGSDFNRWIFEKAYDNGTSPSNDTVKTAQKILAIKAKKEGKINLSVRVAHDNDGNLWYDLGNKAVKINKDGWSIIDSPPILFKKIGHQGVQQEPVKDGKIDDFLNLINIKNERDRILLAVYLITSFIPRFPHPVLVLFGKHGSSKSTTFRLLKGLIDPSALNTLAPVREPREFIQMVSHHWFVPLDNLSGLSYELSDCICRACTGEGMTKRKLFTDDDDVVYKFQHIIGINGINNVISKPDLLDRSILIELDSISDLDRKDETEIQEYFNNIKPETLGACFDIVAEAIRIKPLIKLNGAPRMSDFANWGYAIAEAMGIGGNKFISAYNSNISDQNMEAIEASPIGLIVIAMMERVPNGLIEATPTAMLSTLKQTANDLELDIKDIFGWPKNARQFSRRLKEISPNLKKEGVEVIFGKNTERFIVIKNLNRYVDYSKKDEVPLEEVIVEMEHPDIADDTDDKDIPF